MTAPDAPPAPAAAPPRRGRFAKLKQRARDARRRWRRWEPLGTSATARWTWVRARRAIIAVIGGTTVLLGLAMLVGPGPGLVVVPVGLAVLGLEFVFAVRWLRRLEKGVGTMGQRSGGVWARLRLWITGPKPASPPASPPAEQPAASGP